MHLGVVTAVGVHPGRILIEEVEAPQRKGKPGKAFHRNVVLRIDGVVTVDGLQRVGSTLVVKIGVDEMGRRR